MKRRKRKIGRERKGKERRMPRDRKIAVMKMHFWILD